MPTGLHIHGIQTILLILLVFIAIFAGLAKRLRISYTIVLLVAGLLLTFVPGIPRLPLNPDLIFVVFLPPLLYSAAWQTSWRDFRANLGNIGMLALGLVGFTVAGVTLLAHHFIGMMDWRSGFLLGAVVSPTDAIAATSIARRIGLPRGVVDVLEGESLLNDATGLLALEFGLMLVVRGQIPHAGEGLLRLLWLCVGGIGVGLLVGVVVAWFERFVDDGPIEIVISLIVPYAAYLAGEEVRASGVLAVVACGLYVSRKSATFFSPDSRLQALAVWEALTFVLNGLVFILIGLQLPYVMAGIRGYSTWVLIEYGAIFSIVLIALRLVWMFPGGMLVHFVRTKILRQTVEEPGKRELFVVGWTGMRGVVALAAAISLPETLADGQPFVQRNLIIFLTFCVILVTLVGQGLTLPMVIRRLGFEPSHGHACEENEARQIMLQAALEYLHGERKIVQEHARHAYDDLIHQYEHRLEALTDCERPEESDALRHAGDAARGALQVERRQLIGLRDDDRISDEVLRGLERELDLAESRLQTVIPASTKSMA